MQSLDQALDKELWMALTFLLFYHKPKEVKLS